MGLEWSFSGPQGGNVVIEKKTSTLTALKCYIFSNMYTYHVVVQHICSLTSYTLKSYNKN